MFLQIFLFIFDYLAFQEWNSNDVTASVTYTVILVSYIFNIFIFCYIGEFVAELVRFCTEEIYKNIYNVKSMSFGTWFGACCTFFETNAITSETLFNV